MKFQFRIITLYLLTTSFLFGQKEVVFSKSFNTNSTTSALLTFNIGGGTVEIEESEDDKFYVEHSIEFTNHSDRKKEKIIKEIKSKYDITANMVDNYITTTYENNNNRRGSFRIDYFMSSGYIRNRKNDSLIDYKTHKTFIEDLIETKTPGFNYINFIKNSKYLTEGRKQRHIERYEKNIKTKRYHVKVKFRIPKSLNITINSKFTKLVLSGNLKNRFSIRCNGGRFFADGFDNKDNIIKIKDGIIIMQSMKGGELTLNSTRHAVLGKLSNVRLDSEYSKLEIGRIVENVEITDFTSKFIIHNFLEDFSNFKMNTEYSEINMFFPKNKDYYLETFGYDTAHYWDGITTEIPPSRKNKPSKMMVIGEETNPNKIKINTVHGIIRFGEDFIDFGE